MTTLGVIESTSLIESARALRPQIEACANQIEADRKVPQSLIDALDEAEILRMLVPQEFGGSEATPELFLQVVEELSRADASAGWVASFIANNNISAGCLPEETAADFFADGKKTYLAGSLAPSPRGPNVQPNQAIAVDGGYRLTGQWSYASACMHATIMIAICDIYDGDKPRRHEDGRLVNRWFFFPREDCQIIENWHVMGLRGTGSHAFSVKDAYVPHEQTLPASSRIPTVHPGTLYAFANGTALGTMHSPWGGIATTTISAVCLGIARGAIDAFIEMAGVKKYPESQTLLKGHAIIQDTVGRAEATLMAARAYQLQTLRSVWHEVEKTGHSTPEQFKMLALSGTHTTNLCAQAVDLIWGLAGSSAISIAGPLDRKFRDIHAATQHISVRNENYAVVGKSFLGADSE